jgi:hypothetical protein
MAQVIDALTNLLIPILGPFCMGLGIVLIIAVLWIIFRWKTIVKWWRVDKMVDRRRAHDEGIGLLRDTIERLEGKVEKILEKKVEKILEKLENLEKKAP